MRSLLALVCLLSTPPALAASLQLTGGELSNPGTDTTFDFFVTRISSSQDGVYLRYATRAGTAQAGVDYQPAKDGFELPPGAPSFAIPIGIIGEPGPQPDKSFQLHLARPIPTGGPQSFTTPQHFPDAHVAGRPAIGDLNGDGMVDAVSIYNTEAPGHNFTTHVLVFRNTSTPKAMSLSWASPQTLDFPGASTTAVAIADINGDGKPDLVLLRYLFSPGISVLLNTTEPGATSVTFAPTQGFMANGPGVQLVVADIDGDSRPDVAATDNTNKLAVLLNRTQAGSSTVSFVRGVFDGGGYPTVADFDVDGKPDLVQLDPNGIAVYRNRTAPGADAPDFAPRVTFPIDHNQQSPKGLAALDVNQDGRSDLAVAFDYRVLIVTNRRGLDGPRPGPQASIATGQPAGEIAVADFNGDGVDDLLVGDIADQDPHVAILINVTRKGTALPEFIARGYSTAPHSSPIQVVPADLNADGRPDVLSTDQGLLALLNRFRRASLANPSATATIHYP